MPISVSSINRELYNLLKTKKFEPEGISAAKKSVVPETAIGFNFVFKDGKKQYGSAHVAIDDSKHMLLFFNASAIKPVMRSWTEFIKELKTWGMQHGTRSFKADSLDNLGDYMELREYRKTVNEGYYGTKNTSYSDSTAPKVKLIIKHSKSLDETDQRYRHVEKIFVENALGERFLLPTKKPSVGHVYARHIAEGGNPYDERGKHIAQLAEDIAALGGFIRATRNKQFNESVDTVVFEAASKYLELRETMKRLRGSRGFRNYFENWTPTLIENNSAENLGGAFTHSSLDPRIETALPVLNRYNIGLATLNETYSLDEELQPNLEGQLEKLISLLNDSAEPLSLGPDANNAIGAISDLIVDERLYSRLRKAASADPNNDARPIILGWMSEHVDSDEIYSDVLDSVEDEEESQSTNTEPSPNASVGTVPEPVPPPETEKNPENSENAATVPPPEMSLPEPKQSKTSEPKSTVPPPLEEDSEIRRLRKLCGLG